MRVGLYCTFSQHFWHTCFFTQDPSPKGGHIIADSALLSWHQEQDICASDFMFRSSSQIKLQPPVLSEYLGEKTSSWSLLYWYVFVVFACIATPLTLRVLPPFVFRIGIYLYLACICMYWFVYYKLDTDKYKPLQIFGLNKAQYRRNPASIHRDLIGMYQSVNICLVRIGMYCSVLVCILILPAWIH